MYHVAIGIPLLYLHQKVIIVISFVPSCVYAGCPLIVQMVYMVTIVYLVGAVCLEIYPLGTA